MFRARTCWPWLILCPTCVVAGLWIGDRDAAAGSWDATPAESARFLGLPGNDPSRPFALPSLAPIVTPAAPAVVGIRTIHPTGSADDVPSGERSHGVSAGTGFLIHEDGLIVTAHHLVVDPMLIRVDVPARGRFEAELVGEDRNTDVAVIRLIEPPEDLPSLRFGSSSSLLAGDWVITVGNPLGFDRTVGFGAVSHRGRTMAHDDLQITNDYLQFSATAFRGSSGSPVFDVRGDVVGMTVRVARDAPGMTFALPSDVIGHVLRSMEEHDGRVRRSYMGIQLEAVHDHESGASVKLSRVAEGQPADLADLKVGDLISKFDGREVTSVPELYDWITWSPPESTVVLDVIRSGQRLPPIAVPLEEVAESPSGPAQ